MCPAAYGTINNPSVGAGVPDGPFFRTSCNPALRKRFHISVGADAPVRPPTIAPLASPVIATGASRPWQSASLVPKASLA